MNMLIIGNGFDLALGLPTKYTDFLEFVAASKIVYNHNDFLMKRNPIDCLAEMKKQVDICSDDGIKTKFSKAERLVYRFSNAVKHTFFLKACIDFHQCIHENRWIEYFQERYEQRLMEGENWIDLEAEIKKVIKNLEGPILERVERKVQDNEKQVIHHPIIVIISDINKCREKGTEYIISTQVYRELIKSLREEFNRFVMALGIYLDFFVRLLNEDHGISRDIYNLLRAKEIDCVLSFNYINNYNIKYSGTPIGEDNTCYVHGSVQYWHELQQCNKKGIPLNAISIADIIKKNTMIIGFDEYLSGDNDEYLDFVYYRKYFQRILKGTGSQYLDWLDKYKSELDKNNIVPKVGETREEAYKRFLLEEANKKPNHIYIFGHSMDATDKDIFRDLLLRENNDTKVTIFYHDDEAHDRIITNLIRIISKEILIEKTYGRKPDIEFRKQIKLEGEI